MRLWRNLKRSGPWGRPLMRAESWAFVLTALVAFAIYFYTLAPELTLGWSGIYATSGVYASGSIPPGFPLWSIYAWFFTRLPFSNFAWRISLSSAVAAAGACGLIAAIVSRGGSRLLAGKKLTQTEKKTILTIGGCSSGLAFGMHRVFWGKAVIVEPAALALFLFAASLFLLLRWTERPRVTSYLLGAVFVFALSLSVTLSLSVAIPGLLFLVMLRKPEVGRDLIAVVSLVFGTALILWRFDRLPEAISLFLQLEQLWVVYLALVGVLALATFRLLLSTRRLFTRVGCVALVAILFFLGLAFYLYPSVASMTNPPVNWGYPRTREGFLHVVSRGQFERFNPTTNPWLVWKRLWPYTKSIFEDLGIMYGFMAMLPFFFFQAHPGPMRTWLPGILLTLFSCAILTVVVLNPPLDRAGWALFKEYTPAHHLLVAVLAGYGMILAAALVAQKFNLRALPRKTIDSARGK